MEETIEENPNHRLITDINQLLAEKKGEEAITRAKEEKPGLLAEASWDLVPKICEFLTVDNDKESPDVIDSCEDIFQLIVDASNPKELLLVLLGQLESCKHNVKFKCILKPIQKCLSSLPVKKGHSIAIALETIYGHIVSLPTPEEQNFEGEERKLLECDPCVQKLNEVVLATLKFLDPFVMEVSWKERNEANRKHSKKQINELTRYIVKILGHPMAFLDLTRETPDPDGDGEILISTSRSIADKLVTQLSHLQPNLFKSLVDMLNENDRIEKDHRKKYQRRESTAQSPDDTERDDGGLEEKIPSLGLAVMCLLVFGERQVADSVPQMLHPQHILEICLPRVSVLMQQPDSLIRLKGVKLFSAIVKQVSSGCLSGDMLEWSHLQQVGEDCIQVMIMCSATDVRQMAVALLPLLLSRFDDAGKSKMIHHLLKSSHHSGINSYVIQMLKDELHNMLMSGKINNHLVGIPLERLLEVVFALPNGAESDLMEWCDMIMAALNLLRYLILRDKPKDNVTGFWNIVPMIENKYCSTLRTALNLSRAHYNLEFEKTQKGEYSRKGNNEPEMDFTVGGQKMPQLSKEQQIHVLQTALHRFDMMESILARISDLMAESRKST